MLQSSFWFHFSLQAQLITLLANAAGSTLTLNTARPAYRIAVLQREVGQTFGVKMMTLKGELHPRVYGLVEGTVAASLPLLGLGDRILSINGRNTYKMSHAKCISLFQNKVRYLLFLRLH